MAVAEKPLYYLSIHEAQQLIKNRQLSPVELTQAVLERINAVDGKLHAYINLMADDALREARTAEEEISKGKWRGPMHGIPVAVKDQLDVAGAPARIRQHTRGVGDATAVRKLREAGAIMMGKLAMSSLPDEPPQPRNPWNLDHITGGSSTGSGAAVSAGLCLGSLGEDTAGSIRNPAAFCGIAGLKATYGRVSRYGLAPLSWSLDHCGPMARVVEDTAHMLQVIAGHDPKDPTASTAPVWANYASALREDVKGMVIGVPREYIDECAPRTAPVVLKLVDQAIDALTSLGARTQDVKVPTLHLATIANAVIYYNEFWAAHKNDAAQVLKNGAPQRRARIYLGILTGSADYIQAQRIRSRVRAEFAEIFRTVDCLALPCQAGPAPRFQEMGPIDTLFKHVVPEYHGPFNLTGLPTLSVPCGFSENNLPIALQLVGKPFDEVTILRAGYSYQQRTRWFERRPAI